MNSATKLSKKALIEAQELLNKNRPLHMNSTLRSRGDHWLGKDAPGRPDMTGGGGQQLGKIQALLGELGVGWAYGLAILKRQAKVERWEWAQSDHLQAVIVALNHYKGESPRPRRVK